MKSFLPLCSLFPRYNVAIAVILLVSAPGAMKAADRGRPPVNQYGAPVIDAKGHHINYDRKTLEATARTKGKSIDEPAKPTRPRTPLVMPTPRPQPTPRSRPTPSPPPIDARPFWQYAIFGSGIGASNIVIGPTPPNGAPEIIIGDNSKDDFAADDFWQAIRYNPGTGNYDQIFISPIYQPRNGDPFVIIARIGLAHVTSATDWQIVVMLGDGRIYLYDFVTKAEVGYFDTGSYNFYFGLQGLSLTDLNGDGLAELVVTTPDDLRVFNGSGQLLWEVAGAGGYDVVVGRMDNGTSLKIAATNGKVVDAVTHAVVWDYTNGFGARLKLAPFPGENYQQLISAEAWYYVYSYDVGRQLPRWSIETQLNIDAIEVVDVDNDGVPEVIIGDGQWGTLHVHDLITQSLKWEVNNPEHGVTNIAVGDVDHDGVFELLWGAGYTSTGPDYLYAASTAWAHDIKWQSVDLQGPFLGPAIGDLDGDAQLELVICSRSSNAEYAGGRILVFDFVTLSLRAISDTVSGFDRVEDLKLRDVEGNGRMQIVIATEDGAIGIYRFDSNNTFTNIWMNATLPESAFSFVDVADLDNNGTRKVIGSAYGYVYVYDYPSGTQSWRSVNLGQGGVTGLVVEDLDGNGSKEIAALVSTGDLYTWDGPSRQLRNLRQGTNGTLLSNRASPAGLVLGDTFGVGHFLQWDNNSYTETFTRQLATDCDPYAYTPCINGINITSDNSLWTGIGSVLNKQVATSYDIVVWQSPAIGNSFGRSVVTDVRNGRDCVFSSAEHAVVGLPIVPPPTPTPTPNPRATPRPRPTPPPH